MDYEIKVHSNVHVFIPSLFEIARKTSKSRTPMFIYKTHFFLGISWNSFHFWLLFWNIFFTFGISSWINFMESRYFHSWSLIDEIAQRRNLKDDIYIIQWPSSTNTIETGIHKYWIITFRVSPPLWKVGSAPKNLRKYPQQWCPGRGFSTAHAYAFSHAIPFP